MKPMSPLPKRIWPCRTGQNCDCGLEERNIKSLLIVRETPAACSMFADGGEIGALIGMRDWSETPLGPIADWPQSLRTIVDLVLASPVATVVLWGADFIQLYNREYATIAGLRHPRALGQPTSACWPEMWAFNAPIYAAVMQGETRSFKSQLLPVERHGVTEDAWFDLAYSALRNEAGVVAGVLVTVSETTCQVLAEQRIAGQIRQQWTLFDKAPGFICIFSGPGHVCEFGNEAYARLIGRSGFVGKTIRDTLPDIDGQNLYELLDIVYTTGEEYVGEHLAVSIRRTPGGVSETRYIDFVLAPMHGETGRITGVFGQGHDVTAAHLAHEELVDRKDRLRALNADLEKKVIERTLVHGHIWQLSPDMMAIINVDRGFHASNPAWQAVLGWSEAELAKMRVIELIHPDDLVATRTVFDGLMRGEPVIHFVNRYRATDGTYRWLSWVAVGEEGKVYCTARDVTDQKNQALELERAHVDLRALFETSNQMQGLLTIDGIVVDLNRTSLDAIKARREDVVGKPFWETAWFTDTQGMPEIVRLAVATVAGGEEVRAEASLNVAAEMRIYDFSMRPIRDVNGTVIGIVPEGIDITDRRQAEEARRQGQKLEAMGQLTGGVAHDFNNLLTPIIGALDFLQRRGVDDPRTCRLIDGAMQSAERAKALVQRLLAFARLQPLQSSAVDVEAIIAGMADLITITCGQKIQVMVDVARDLPAAQADVNQLEMAILNLSVNARDAMPDGGRLTISASSETVEAGGQPALTAGRYVRLSVSDTGSGMDEATRASAIEPFFSTKPVGQGTGLGLSMVHGLTTQLGGGMTIASAPGLGTTVALWLPVGAKRVDALGGGIVQLRKIASVRGTAPVGPKALGTALLVDDEELVRIIAADMLGEMGFAVIEASSAEDALRMLNSGIHIDLLVTDHMMPGMTGTGLALHVRAKWPGTVALIVSGYVDAEGMSAELPRLTKPFRQVELKACIAKLMAEANVAGGLQI